MFDPRVSWGSGVKDPGPSPISCKESGGAGVLDRRWSRMSGGATAIGGSSVVSSLDDSEGASGDQLSSDAGILSRDASLAANSAENSSLLPPPATQQARVQ